MNQISTTSVGFHTGERLARYVTYFQAFALTYWRYYAAAVPARA